MKAKSRQKLGVVDKTTKASEPWFIAPAPREVSLTGLLYEQIEYLKQELRAAQQREVEMRRELLAVLRPGPSARVEAYRQAERQYQRPEAEVEERPLGEGVPWTQELYAHGALIPPEERLTPEEQAILDTARQREEEMIAEANARAEGYGKPLTAEAEPVTVGGEENEEKEIPV